MHHKKTWRAGASIAVHNSHSPRMGRARVRGEARGVSRLAQQEYNRRQSRLALTLKINHNFLHGDLNVVWKHSNRERDWTPEEAAQAWRTAVKELRKRAADAEVPLRWIHALAVGVRGALHHHIIMNREMAGLLAGVWLHGSVHYEPLWPKQNYQGLAWYFCGQEKGENPNDARMYWIYGNKYSTSRNVVKPEYEAEALEADSWERYPDAEPGYEIDINSLDVGENPVNGKPYQFYIMLPARPAPSRLSAEKKLEWAERERAKNAALVKWKLDKLYAELEERKLRWQAGRDGDGA